MAPAAPPDPVAPRAFPRFKGRVQIVARVLWWVVAAISVWMTIRAIPLNVADARSLCPDGPCLDARLTASQLRSLQAAGLSLNAYVGYVLAVNLVPPIVYLAVALVLFLRKPDDGMAYFTALALVLFGCVTFPDFPQQLAMRDAAYVIPYVVLKYLGSISLIAFFFLFPTGRIAPRWIRAFLAVYVIEELLDVVSMPPLGWRWNPEIVTNGSIIVVPLVAIYAQVYRYRRVSTPDERRQTRWVVAGIALAMALFVLSAATSFAGVMGRDNLVGALALYALITVAITLIPISIAIAILRSHLYDIDLLINRTVLYGTVTAILAGVLAVSSDLTKRLFLAFTGQQSDVAPMIATLTVVAAFDPVRKRVSRFVDARFKYPTRSFGAFEERLQDHIFNGRRHIRPERPDRRRRLVDVRHNDRRRDRRVEGHATRDHLVQHDTERVDVRARVDRFALAVLGRHVARRADDHARSRQSARRRVLQRRDAEVDDLDDSRRIADDDVVGLQVPMHDAEPVRGVHRVADLRDDPGGLRKRHRTPLVEHRAQAAPVEQLHHEVCAAFGRDAKVVDRDGVGVDETRGRLRFAPEAGGGGRFGDNVRAQHLHGHQALQMQVASTIDSAHAAFANQRFDLVLAVEDDPDHRSSGRVRQRLEQRAIAWTELRVLSLKRLAARRTALHRVKNSRLVLRLEIARSGM